MSRAVPEWIGRTDDAKIPPRVMERVARKYDGRCIKCTRETGPALPGECDHIVPLILGGKHRERNLQWLCKPCHAAKSRLDVKLKAKAARISQRNLGIKRKPSRSWGYGKDDKFKMKIGGEIVPR